MFFGGSARAFSEPTGDYDLHLFSRKQPDLNWEHPALRRAVYDMVHRWLRCDVDCFRMEVINASSKVQDVPDALNPSDEVDHATVAARWDAIVISRSFTR